MQSASSKPASTPATRRQMLRRLCFLGMGTGTAGVGSLAWGSMVERHWLTTEHLDITLPHLPSAMDGFRVVQISDLHLEPWTKASEIAETVAACNELRPDLVVITGDLITSSHKPAGELGSLLSKLETKHGTFASLGNHDVWHKPTDITRALRQHGVPVLRNEGRLVRTGRGDLLVAGLDSFWAGRPNLNDALRGWRPGLPLLLLVHEPDGADKIAPSGVPALQLSGHTHGGQVCLPSPRPLPLHVPSWGKKYKHGLHRVGTLQVYVNRGIGCVSLPIRFACPPEITVITLRSPEAAV